MPTTLPELTEQLRTSLSISLTEATTLIGRLMPTLVLLEPSETGLSPGALNWSLGRELQPSVAGEFSEVQLLNPAGSGMRVFISQVSAKANANLGIRVASFDTPLATLSANKSWADFETRGSPGAEIRRDTDVAQRGTALLEGATVANTVFSELFPSPVVLSEGQGLLVGGNVVNVTLTANFFWREERI